MHPSEFAMKKPGFTLIELLVVVAIISALIAILLPSLGKAKELSRRAACASNQRQIATAAITYATANRLNMPQFESHATQIMYWTIGATVYNPRPFLSKLVGGTHDVFYCPSGIIDADGWGDDESQPPTVTNITVSLLGLWEPIHSQGATAWAAGWQTIYTEIPISGNTNKPYKYSAAPLPAEMAMTTDSQQSYSGGNGFSLPGQATWNNDQSYYGSYPHRTQGGAWAGTNSAFYDGHAAWSDFAELYDESAGYPYGAKWMMWENRGDNNFETPFYW